MYVGLRVVRGPKWDYDDEIDGGEGFVGTVVAVGSHSSSLPEKFVKVQWDCGTQHHHRAGFHGACDLYVFDSSPTGVNHENIGCGACNQNPILGIRWQCVSCRGLNLCTSCYMSDKHDKEHRFQRIDEPGSVGREVGTRHNSRKIEAKGIFPGAEVKRGPDWKYGDQDGGIGKRGSVQKLISWRDKPKNAVVVRWHETQTGKYRLGYKGRVDILCTIPYSGGWYYKEHLKKLGEPVEMKQKSPYQTTKSHIARKKECTKGLEVGDEVRIDMSMEDIMSLQETSFGWAPDMATCIGKVGIVNNFEDNNGVAIWFDGSEEPWTFDVRAVSKVNTQHRKKGKDALHKDDIRDKSRVSVKNASASSASSAFEERFCPEVRVRVMADEELVKRLQVGHGVQDKLLCNTLGKVGVVTEVDMDGDIVVQFDYEEESLTFNPAVLIPIKERGRTDADEESGAALTSERTMPMYLDEGSRQAGESLISHASQGHLGVVQHLLGGLTDAKRALVVNYLAGGHTALHQACHSGHTAVVETLLRHGASLQLQDPQGYSALHHASYGDYSGSTAALLIKEGADIDDNRNSVMSTPLHLAVNQHNTQAALVLIQHGCDVNLGDLNGRTPLHGAVKLGNSQMVETILKTKPPPAAAVVDLHICDNEGLNPFHLAAQEKFAGAVKQMISYSEDIVNVKENNGFTALHLSALRNDFDTAKILLEWGCCDVKATSRGGATAADLAASAGNELMLVLLANYDAEIHDYVKSMAGSTSSDLQTHSFQKGDQVVVKAEGEALKALQIGHGGWNFEMSLVSKKIGSVIEVMPTGDVCVFFEHLLKAFVFNPATLKPHISQEDDSTPALEHTVADMCSIHREAAALERHKECVRVLMYGTRTKPEVKVYVFSVNGVPDCLKREAEERFTQLNVTLKLVDLCKDADNSPYVRYPSGFQTLPASTMSEIAKIIEKYSALFSRHSNITLVHPSFKVKRFVQTEEPCIAVYVLGKNDVPLDECHIPATIEGFAVDVVEGFWSPCAGPPTILKTQKRTFPLELGVSIGIEGSSAAGTLGAFVEDEESKEVFVLTCDHVLEGSERRKKEEKCISDVQSTRGEETTAGVRPSGDEPLEHKDDKKGVVQPSLLDHIRKLERVLEKYKDHLKCLVPEEEQEEGNSERDKQSLQAEFNTLFEKKEEYWLQVDLLQSDMEKIEKYFYTCLPSNPEGDDKVELGKMVNDYRKKLAKLKETFDEEDEESKGSEEDGEDSTKDLKQHFDELVLKKGVSKSLKSECKAKLEKLEKKFRELYSKEPRIIASYVNGIKGNQGSLRGKEVYIDACLAKLEEKEEKSLAGKVPLATQRVRGMRGKMVRHILALSESSIVEDTTVYKCGRSTELTCGKISSSSVFPAGKQDPSLNWSDGDPLRFDVLFPSYSCKECLEKLRSNPSSGSDEELGEPDTSVPEKDFLMCFNCEQKKECVSFYALPNYCCDYCADVLKMNLTDGKNSFDEVLCNRCRKIKHCREYKEKGTMANLRDKKLKEVLKKVTLSRNCFMVRNKIAAQPFATPGDSGAAIIDEDGKAVGLLFAIVPSFHQVFTLACPMDLVLSQLGQLTNRKLRLKTEFSNRRVPPEECVADSAGTEQTSGYSI